MDIARLNFSHGSHEDHARVIAELRRLAYELERPIGVLQDLQGPKIRIGALENGNCELRPGSRFVLTTEERIGDHRRASTTYAGLPGDVRAGDQVLLSDGLLRLEVEEVCGVEVRCVVVDGGRLRERAGINLPGAELSVPSLTEKDLVDLAFGIEQEVDFVALSFVRRAEDVVALREALAEAPIWTIAKLEKPQAIDALDEILEVADGVMVARGDLGVEMSPERVPFVQKTIIRRAARARVPVITATQMLESMIEHPRPTRAEASDVANAVFDGTDAVMLSGETSIGRQPLGTVRMMDRIVREAESHLSFASEVQDPAGQAPESFPDAMADAAGRVAADLHAAAIVAFTESGFTARLISKHRPSRPIFAFTPHARILRQLCLYWGVQPRQIEVIQDVDRMIEAAEAALREEGVVEVGDRLVFLAGKPVQGTTNLMRLHRVGDPL